MHPLPPENAAAPTTWRFPWQPVLALILVAGVFAPSIGFQFVNWDDDFHVLRNPAVQGQGPWADRLLTPRLGYPIPLTVFMWRAEVAIAGLTPWLFHLTNVLLHLGSCAFVYRLARALGLQRVGATVALLLFGLHPVAAEPVSWVTGGKDVLSLFLDLAATLAFFSTARDGATNEPLDVSVEQRFGGGAKRTHRFVGVLLFVLAALAKPTALFVPLAWLFLLRYAGRQPWRRVLAAIVPTLLPAALILGLAFAGQSELGAISAGRSPAVMARQVWYALGYHLSLLFLVQDPLAKHIPASMPPHFEAGVDLLPLLVVAALALLRGATTARRRTVVVGLLWAGAAYLPSAGLVPLVRFLADSYLYPALVGVGWAVGALCETDRRRLARLRNLAIPTISLALAWIALWTSLGWRDGVALWTRVSARYPDSPQVCRNLGNAFFEAHRLDEALAGYQRCAARFGPVAFDKNIGITLVSLRRFAEADIVLTRAAARQPGDAGIDRYLRLARDQVSP